MYYYAAAALPHLNFDSEVLPSVEDFFSLCALSASESDLQAIASARLEPQFGLEPQPRQPAHSMVRAYWNWELGLRNGLAQLRAHALNREAPVVYNDMASDCTAIAGLSDALKAIMQSTSPLEADTEIDRLRWQYLNELGSGHFFDVEQMIVYYLRLQILVRRRSLVVDRGREIYKSQYMTICQRASQNGVQT